MMNDEGRIETGKQQRVGRLEAVVQRLWHAHVMEESLISEFMNLAVLQSMVSGLQPLLAHAFAFSHHSKTPILQNFTAHCRRAAPKNKTEFRNIPLQNPTIRQPVEKGDWLRPRRVQTRQILIIARCLSPFSTGAPPQTTSHQASHSRISVFHPWLPFPFCGSYSRRTPTRT